MNMDQVYEDIKQAISFIEKKSSSGYNFLKYSTSFIFTTENQEALNKVLAYKGKDVLSVASAGDQYLAAVYYDANKVDLFDVNRFAYYISYLKIAAVLILDYDEFMNFFVPVHNHDIQTKFWDLKTLKKILPILPNDVSLFWKEVMFRVKTNGYGNFVSPSNIYNNMTSVVQGMPFYKSKKEYYILKQKLLSRDFPLFEEVDLASIKNKVSDKYDILYLSNIVECMVRSELNTYYLMSFSLEDDVEMKKAQLICQQVEPLVKKDGVVLFSYRANSSRNTATDYLYNNELFDVHILPAKILPYDDFCFEVDDVDLALTYKPNER